MDTALITAVTTLFTAMNRWDAWLVVLFIFFVPPALGLWSIIRISQSVGSLERELRVQQNKDAKKFEDMVALSEKHFEAFTLKYDNNIYLVQNYEKFSGDLATIVHLNTQAITRLVDRIDFSQIRVSVNKRGEE
jgi:hypothetical protein